MNFWRKIIVFCAGVLAGAALMLIVTKTAMQAQAASKAEFFSQFLERIGSDSIKEVTYTGGAGIAYVTVHGQRFVTTAPPPQFEYPGLTKMLVERGVTVAATQR